jgi:hypothetical protein
MNGEKTLKFIATIAAFASVSASAQMGAETGTTTGAVTGTRMRRMTGSDRLAAEVKPYPAVMGFGADAGASGLGSVGASVEWMTNRYVAVHADGYVLDTGLGVYEEDDKEEGISPDTVTGYSAELGARYYGEPETSTWYAGAKLGFTEVSGDYKYKDREDVKARYGSLTPGLQAGYRWLVGFQEDILIRLGAVAAANVVQYRDRDMKDLTGTADETEARAELDDRIEAPVLASIDLGIGYQF